MRAKALAAAETKTRVCGLLAWGPFVMATFHISSSTLILQRPSPPPVPPIPLGGWLSNQAWFHPTAEALVRLSLRVCNARISDALNIIISTVILQSSPPPALP